MFMQVWGIFIGTVPKAGLPQGLKSEDFNPLENHSPPPPAPQSLCYVISCLCSAVLRLYSLALEMFMYSLPGVHTWSRGAGDKGLIWEVASHSPLQPPSFTQGKQDHCSSNLIANQCGRNHLLLSSLWIAISCDIFPHIQASLLVDTR